MSTETMEIVELCEALPAAKRAEVTDFARFLLGRTQGAYGLGNPELRSVSRRLHAKAQTARRKGTAKKFHGDLEAVLAD
ncbi:MAG: hypothetical protein ACKOJB_16080 [Chthoniobacterales bacterium]